MHRPKVSVVLPTYNRAGLVSKTIQSVLAQTFPDFELIVVDDGSTDDTRTVVEQFNDPRIRYLWQENRGVSSALNTGAQNAQGKYVAFIGSDDIWLPDLLEAEVSVMDTHPDIGLVYARAGAIDEHDRLMPQIRGAPEHYPGETFKSLLYGDFVCAITAIVRRECLDQAGPFDETLGGNEDWDMWVRIGKHYRFLFIDRVLARFRIHKGSLTNGSSSAHAQVTQHRIRILDKAFSAPDLPKEIVAIKSLAYRNVYMDMGLRWLTVRRLSRSAYFFWKAIVTSPNPVTTCLRILYLVLLWHFLSKHDWGIEMVSAAVDLRRRGRHIRSGPH